MTDTRETDLVALTRSDWERIKAAVPRRAQRRLADVEIITLVDDVR